MKAQNEDEALEVRIPGTCGTEHDQSEVVMTPSGQNVLPSQRFTRRGKENRRAHSRVFKHGGFAALCLRCAAALAFCLLAFSPSLLAQDVCSGTCDWNFPTNWSYGTPPNSGNDVEIKAAATATVDFSPAVVGNFYLDDTGTLILPGDSYENTDAAVSLTISGSADFGQTASSLATVDIDDGSTLTLNGATTNYGTINLYSQVVEVGLAPERGTLYNNGTLANYGTLNDQGTLQNNSGGTLDNYGTLTNDGTLYNDDEGALTNNELATIVNNGTLYNFGGALYTNAGTLQNNGNFDDEGELINNELATIVNNGTLTNDGGTLDNYGTLYNNELATIVNNGTLYNGFGGTLDNYSYIINNATLINNGTLYNNELATIVNNGTLYNGFGGTLDNYSYIINNATLINNGTLYNDDEGALTNNELATIVNNGTLFNDGGIDNSGYITNYSGGTLQNNAGATLTNYGGTLDNNGGDIVNDGTLFNEVDGTINNNDGGIVNGGTLYNFGGTLDNYSYIINNATLINDGTLYNDDEGALTNNELATIVNNGTLFNDGGIDNSGYITNYSGGTLQNNAGATLTNYGTINNVEGGQFLLQAGSSFNNSGSLVSDSSSTFQTAANSTIVNTSTGTMSFGNTVTINGSLQNDGAITLPSLSVSSTGTLSGIGTVTAPLPAGVIVDGVMAPGDGSGGTFTIHGNYTQNADGTLDILLGGTGAGEFGQLDVTGDADLSGALDVSLFGGFDPEAGDTFEFLESGGITGDFASLLFPTIDGLSFQLNQEGDDLFLDVISSSSGTGGGTTPTPEPGTMLLLASGMAALGLMRRWRVRRVEA